MEIIPGTYRRHLTGDAAYQSFVPESLWKISEEKQSDGILWHKNSEIVSAADSVQEKILQLNEEWRFHSPEERGILLDQLLRQETEASVLMAYPRQASTPAFGFPMPDLSSITEVSGWDPMGSFINTVDAYCPSVEEVPEVLRPMAEEDIENLYYAGRQGIELLEKLPLSGRLLKELHYIALYAGHYDKMYRGEFRRSPVWIGEDGMDLRSASFIPPVEEDMDNAFSDLEKFLHYQESADPIVKAALVHYQFETIHPFIDGNGRLGRLFSLLYLKEACEAECPWILLSPVMLQGIDRYYKEIRTVQLYGDYPRWTLWFFGVLKEAITRTIEAVRHGSGLS